MKARINRNLVGFWQRLRRLLPGLRVWLVIIAVVVLIFGAGMIAWGVGLLAPSRVPISGPPAPIPPPGPWLEVETVPRQTIRVLGEEMTIKFLFTNFISEPLTVKPFPPQIEIRSLQYELVRTFRAGSQELEIEAGKKVTYKLTWDQRGDRGQQVSPGWYYVNVEGITAIKASPPKITEMSFGTVTKILVQFPQGAMEKIIKLNLSQTSGGLTITLDRVELSAMGARFWAFTAPPESYRYPPSAPGVPPPPPMVPVHAQYIANGIVKDAGYSGCGFEDNRFRLIWGHAEALLDPVPSDAKELTFRITKFGDQEGPWEFRLSLK